MRTRLIPWFVLLTALDRLVDSRRDCHPRSDTHSVQTVILVTTAILVQTIGRYWIRVQTTDCCIITKAFFVFTVVQMLACKEF